MLEIQFHGMVPWWLVGSLQLSPASEMHFGNHFQLWMNTENKWRRKYKYRILLCGLVRNKLIGWLIDKILNHLDLSKSHCAR